VLVILPTASLVVFPRSVVIFTFTVISASLTVLCSIGPTLRLTIVMPVMHLALLAPTQVRIAVKLAAIFQPPFTTNTSALIPATTRVPTGSSSLPQSPTSVSPVPQSALPASTLPKPAPMSTALKTTFTSTTPVSRSVPITTMPIPLSDSAFSAQPAASPVSA